MATGLVQVTFRADVEQAVGVLERLRERLLLVIHFGMLDGDDA